LAGWTLGDGGPCAGIVRLTGYGRTRPRKTKERGEWMLAEGGRANN
jgi:hypothetical protein